jgi:hypothetical protein
MRSGQIWFIQDEISVKRRRARKAALFRGDDDDIMRTEPQKKCFLRRNEGTMALGNYSLEICVRKQDKILEADNGDEKMENPRMNELTRAASFLNHGHFPGHLIRRCR